MLALPRLALGIIIGFALAAILALFVVAPVALARSGGSWLLSGFYDNIVLGIAARRGAPAAPSPSAPAIAASRGERFGGRFATSAQDAYLGSCAECHGVKGDGRGQFGPATAPVATNLLSNDAKRRSDAELFWIIKNGVGFSAMPGYADQYSDTEITAMVAWVRSLQHGQAQPVSVPSPTAQQLAFANPASNQAAQRGAAVYFAAGCQECHGATGNAPGNLALRPRGEMGAVRRGRPGMPAYGTNQISEQQLSDLAAYMQSWPSSGGVPRRGDD